MFDMYFIKYVGGKVYFISYSKKMNKIFSTDED